MKKYEIIYAHYEITGEAYKKLIDYAWDKSDYFSINEYTKNAVILDELDKANLICSIEYSDNSSRHLFKLNDETKAWLKSKEGIFNFDRGQNLYFYKDGHDCDDAWFITTTHEEIFWMILNENELEDLDNIDKNYFLHELK